MAGVDCPSCARENPDGFLHCGYCGAPLSGPVSPRRRLASLVFCDLVGSTALGERVDPESLQELMRLYFAEMRAALERHGGSVEKFIGDAVVGVFGVPAGREDDALRACRAALEMQTRVAELNVHLWQRFHTELAVRIGVNSGEVVGSEETFVTGDAVNVAARLEQAAGPGEVLIGETTLRLARGAVRVEEIGPLVAKGKAEPLLAYRLLEVGEAVRHAATPLVGRQAELVALEGALSARECRLVTIVGDAGVGKSRLTAELLARIGERARVVRGACLSYGEGITFWAVAQVVRALAGIRDEDSVEEARARVPPRIAQLIGLAEGSTTAEQNADAVASFVAAAAGEQPLVIVVDDIHWAEPALLDLLARLPARVGEAPVVLLCLARPELLEARPDWPVTVRLEPLGAAEVDELLDRLAAPAAVRVRLAQTAGGNPLYAEELVAWVRDGGELDEMPTTLNALLGARLDRLEGTERDALERGAVEGEIFHQAAIVALSDEPVRPSVPSELGRLERKELIRLAAASLVAGGVAYRFKHILVREAAYRATAKRLRAELHERYADWLERGAGARLGEYHEILGYHFEQAYRYREELGAIDADARLLAARAGHHLGAAGRRANDRADVRAASNLLGRAAALLPPDSVERLEVLRHLAYAVGETGLLLESRAIAQELYERATAIGERALAAHGRSGAIPNPFFDDQADVEGAEAGYNELIEEFTELGDRAGLAEAARRLARVYAARGQRGLSIEWGETALEHATACGDMSTRLAVTFSLSQDLVGGPVPVAQALPRVEALLETCGDDRVLEAAVLCHRSVLLAMAGRFEEWRDCERRAGPVLREAAVESLSWGPLDHAAYACRLAGDREGAKRALEAKWRLYPVENGRTHKLAMNAAAGLADLYCDEGRWDDAEAILAEYRDVRRYERVEARIAAHRGRIDEALVLAQRAAEAGEGNEMLNVRARGWLTLAEVQRTAGLDPEADASIERAISLYEQKGNVAAIALVRRDGA
jgi:class 3 adenylate cyclase/tetratricopeptide (TPR) repeat protein